jgi:fatty acid desaturase
MTKGSFHPDIMTVPPMQVEPKVALTAFHSEEVDAPRLSHLILLCHSLLYLSFAVALAGILPFWTLLVLIPLLLVRWILFIHDLFHLRSAKGVNLVIRLLPILLTPLALGYREYHEIHHQHHRCMATPRDPEYYQICGSPLRGFFNAMLNPEQAYFRWLASRGMDRTLLVGTAIRLGLFVAIAYLTGWAFLWFWLPLRLSHGLSYFAFFYCLHRRGDEYGVYPLHLPILAQRVFTLLFGRNALYELCYHHVHHAHPRVAPQHLPIVGE